MRLSLLSENCKGWKHTKQWLLRWLVTWGQRTVNAGRRERARWVLKLPQLTARESVRPQHRQRRLSRGPSGHGGHRIKCARSATQSKTTRQVAEISPAHGTLKICEEGLSRLQSRICTGESRGREKGCQWVLAGRCLEFTERREQCLFPTARARKKVRGVG